MTARAAEVSMKITQLLKRDHDTLQNLFKLYEQAWKGAYRKKENLFFKIKRELEILLALEEEIFYPALRKVRSREARDITSQALDNHQVLRTMVLDIAELRPFDEEFDPKVSELEKHVLDHIGYGEGVMFREAKKNLSVEKLEVLAEEMEERKEELLAYLSYRTVE